MAIEARASIAENPPRTSLNCDLKSFLEKFFADAMSTPPVAWFYLAIKKVSSIFLELIMKKLFVFGLCAIAGTAMAAGPSVSISGSSDQALIMFSSNVANAADGDRARAQQNLSTNAGNIDIKGDSQQTTDIFQFLIDNKASANSLAQQSLSSNVGDVSITGHSVQLSFLTGGSITNSATGYGASAIQSAASNTSCVTCK